MLERRGLEGSFGSAEGSSERGRVVCSERVERASVRFLLVEG